MMTVARLAPRMNVKDLLSKAEGGDVMAALELARAYGCESVEEVLAVVCPLGRPSVPIFDVCADAYALKAWQEGSTNEGEVVR